MIQIPEDVLELLKGSLVKEVVLTEGKVFSYGSNGVQCVVVLEEKTDNGSRILTLHAHLIYLLENDADKGYLSRHPIMDGDKEVLYDKEDEDRLQADFSQILPFTSGCKALSLLKYLYLGEPLVTAQQTIKNEKVELIEIASAKYNF